MYNSIQKDEIKVLETVKTHLQQSTVFLNEYSRPKGGIFIKPKPKNIRLDVIELNLIVAIQFGPEIKGVLNINHQDEDEERLKEVNPIIIDVMDSSYKEYYLFSVEGTEMYRISKYLYLSNIRVEFLLYSVHYDPLTGYTK